MRCRCYPATIEYTEFARGRCRARFEGYSDDENAGVALPDVCELDALEEVEPGEDGYLVTGGSGDGQDPRLGDGPGGDGQDGDDLYAVPDAAHGGGGGDHNDEDDDMYAAPDS